MFADPNYSIQLERGFGETFQYLKEGWIALILVILAVRAGNGLYTCLVAVFAFLLVDDLFAAHSRAGEILGQALQLAPVLGLRARDMGELIVIGVAVVVLAIPIAVEFVRGDAQARSFWRSMVVLLVALAAFGVLFDAVHITLLSHPSWEAVLGTIEDGGEMIVMSLIFRLVFRAWHGSTRLLSEQHPATPSPALEH